MGAGFSATTRRAFDLPSGEQDKSSALEQAVAVGRRNHQLAIWDRAGQQWAIAIHDEQTKLHPLTDEEAALVLNRDPLIRREWNRWNAMTGNLGSLVLLDGERVRRVLAEVNDEPDDHEGMQGLA